MLQYELFLAVLLRVVMGDSARAELLTRQALLAQLLDEKIYDSTIAPNFNEEVPTNVTVQLFVLNVHSLNEAGMDFSMEVILRQNWIDKRLTYERPGWKKLELGSGKARQVWSPDTVFYNEKEGQLHTVTTENKLIHIHSDGSVFYSARLSLTLSCSMDLTLFPLDEQFCPIVLYSFAHTTENILFYWHQQATEFRKTSLAQFDVDLGRLRYFGGISRLGEIGSYSHLAVQIPFRRKVGHYVIQLFIPSILVVMLSWVNFWLDEADVSSRISLGVITVLTITTMSSDVKGHLPPVSYVKAVDVYMLVCQSFVVCALLEFAFVNAWSRHFRTQVDTEKSASGEQRTPDDRKSSEADMYTVCTDDASQKVPNANHKKVSRNIINIFIPKRGLKPGEEQLIGDVKRADQWSRKLFPAIFLLFLIVFFSYVGVISKQGPAPPKHGQLI